MEKVGKPGYLSPTDLMCTRIIGDRCPLPSEISRLKIGDLTRAPQKIKDELEFIIIYQWRRERRKISP